MTLGELLDDQAILVGLDAQDLESALRALLEVALGSGGADVRLLDTLAHEVASGETGDLTGVADGVVIASIRVDEAPALTAGLALLKQPVPASLVGDETVFAQAILLLVTPRRLATLRAQVVPTLARVLLTASNTRALLQAESVAEVRAVDRVLDAHLRERLLVEDILQPVTFRIYPDTPVEEVVDLMIRRELRAVPVVGKEYEVLGLITAGDALKYLLTLRRVGEDMGRETSQREIVARDIMTRSVMCVSEEQTVVEAANLLANKSVEQLPVVREGELIGFVTRGAALRALASPEPTGEIEETQE